MIVVDSSALIAILADEPEGEAMLKAIADADRCLISAVNYQDTGQVALSRWGANGVYDLEEFVELIGAEVVPYDGNLARFAVEVFKRFGKGIHPDARLNFCDCAAYALAKANDAPLLFKGDDFVHTDVKSCL